jgi:hypothetical protein
MDYKLRLSLQQNTLTIFPPIKTGQTTVAAWVNDATLSECVIWVIEEAAHCFTPTVRYERKI